VKGATVKPRWPLLLAMGYSVLVCASALILLFGEDAVAGVLLLVLAFPWSYVFTALVDAVNPALLDSGMAGVLDSLHGGAINAAIIYLLASALARRSAA
jgi:hypothetical protein